MVGRVLAAFGQGAFLPIAAVVAADMVAPKHRSRAIAVVFAGGTAANVVGTPLGTLLGQHLGWRSTFCAVAALAAAALALSWATLPASPPAAGPSTLRGEFAAFGRAQVWSTLTIGMAAFGGLFAMLTYVTPLLTEVSGFPGTAVAPLLVLFGLGLVAGNALGGWFGGRAPLRTLAVALAALTAGLATLALGASEPLLAAAALTVVGTAAFAVVAPFLSRLVEQAHEAPLLAAAAGGSAVNLGAAVGAQLGGMSLSTLDLVGPSAVGAGISSLGLVVVVIAAVHTRRGTDPTAARAGVGPASGEPGEYTSRGSHPPTVADDTVSSDAAR